MPDPLTKQHRNHTITIDPNDFQFYVSGQHFDMLQSQQRRYRSFEEAIQKINSECDAWEQFRAKNIQIREKLVTEAGEIVTVIGINRATNDIRIEEKNIELRGRALFPTEKLDQVRRMAAVRKELNTLTDELSDLGISISRGYGRVDASDYPRKLTLLQDQITKKREQATQNPLPITKTA